VYDLFVQKGNKNYHFWCRGTTSGNFRIFQLMPGKKTRFVRIALHNFHVHLCHEEVAKTKISTFGAGAIQCVCGKNTKIQLGSIV
jgi:hypothetical protein